MNKIKANKFLEAKGFDMEVDKFDGIWFMVNAYRGYGQPIRSTEGSCMNIVRMGDMTEFDLLFYANKLAKED